MLTRGRNKKTLANFTSSGPESSHITPPKKKKQTPNQKVQDIQEQFESFKAVQEEKNLHIENKIANIETKFSSGLGTKEDPITLLSSNLTPELRKIGSSLHIWDACRVIVVDFPSWKYEFSHVPKLAEAMRDCFDIVENVKQLPPTFKNGYNRYPMNIEFKNPMCRSIGAQLLKERCRDIGSSIPIQYSLADFPILKHNVCAMSTILRGLKKDGIVSYYSLNNFMAVEHMEKLAPMFSFMVPGMEKPTEFRLCPTNELYMSGFCIPQDDFDHQSPEFQQLKNSILEYIMTMRDSLANSVIEKSKTESETSSTPYSMQNSLEGADAVKLLNIDVSLPPPPFNQEKPSPSSLRALTPSAPVESPPPPQAQNSPSHSPSPTFPYPPPTNRTPPLPPSQIHFYPKIPISPQQKSGHQQQWSPPVPVSQIYGNAMGVLNGIEPSPPKTMQNQISPTFFLHPSQYRYPDMCSPILGSSSIYQMTAVGSPPMQPVNQARFITQMNNEAPYQQVIYQ